MYVATWIECAQEINAGGLYANPMSMDDWCKEAMPCHSRSFIQCPENIRVRRVRSVVRLIALNEISGFVRHDSLDMNCVAETK
jgi:hypothetical protein